MSSIYGMAEVQEGSVDQDEQEIDMLGRADFDFFLAMLYSKQC